MGWLSSTTWSTSDTPVLADVLNDIGLDIRTWGANVDAAGYRLTNCGGVDGGASSAITFAAGGSERLRIASDGKVGIGTPSPAALLDLQGSGDYQALIGGGAPTTSFEIGRQTTTGATVGFLRFYGRQSGYGGFVFSNVDHTAMLTIKANGVVNIAGLPSYASNSAAITGGLVAGDLYRNGDAVSVVH